MGPFWVELDCVGLKGPHGERWIREREILCGLCNITDVKESCGKR